MKLLVSHKCSSFSYMSPGIASLVVAEFVPEQGVAQPKLLIVSRCVAAIILFTCLFALYVRTAGALNCSNARNGVRK
jgi:hypothetical protein